jgi:hypothetical protein
MIPLIDTFASIFNIRWKGAIMRFVPAFQKYPIESELSMRISWVEGGD